MLDLRRLRALTAVLETGSVTAAAQLIGYTPSAVSQNIALLEREIGTELLERVGRGVRPTKAGLLLAEHAGAVLARAAEAEAAVAALRASQDGALRLVTFSSAGAALIPPALAGLRQQHPEALVELRVGERDEALPMVRDDEVDLAVIIASRHAPMRGLAGLVYTDLMDDPFWLVVPRSHALARRRVIRLAELAEEAWVESICTVGCCLEAANEAFQRAGYVPRRAIQADDYWPAQGFVAAGFGIALIPSLGLTAVHDGVVIRRLHPDDHPVRRIQAVTRRSGSDRRLVRSMITALTQASEMGRFAGT